MAEFDFDMAVIGGGVVGLGILHQAAARGLNAVLLERHAVCGQETSSRNSEVVHGGMYYAPGSLKAKLCVEGRRLLYEFAEKHNVPHKRIGKTIVAVNAEEVAGLEKINANGQANGVEGLRFLSTGELEEIAPGVRAEAALYSPETGVVNAHGLMEALERGAEANGGIVVCKTELAGLAQKDGGWELRYNGPDGPDTSTSRVVVNAAGLRAQRVMRMAGMDPDACDLAFYPCKGNYFSVQGESRKRIHGLVYPAPEANLAGLGIHTLVDFSGSVKLGPNVEYVEPADEYDYSVDESLRDAFFASASRYLPFLRKEDIAPDMSGMRPKLAGPGQAARDFYIAHERERGLEGFVNLAGIESPGLTACLAIGDMVLGLL